MKLLDFGIAKGGSELSLSGATKTGLALGTPYYMSPEQVVGAKTIDLRTDLWSLAIVVFQCTLGRRPFDADNFGELAVLIHTAPMPAPSSLDPSLPRAFDDWFAVAAARDPLQRFSNAKSFADALTAVAREGTWAPSQTGPRAAPLPGEPSTGNAALRAASSSSLHSSTNVGLGLGSGAQPPLPASRGAAFWVAGIGAVLVFGSGGIWLATRSSGGPRPLPVSTPTAVAALPPCYLPPPPHPSKRYAPNPPSKSLSRSPPPRPRSPQPPQPA